MSTQREIGIVGAGPSGLAMSLFLDQEAEILESDSRPGGHASSYCLDGFTFDYGPHIMFSKNKPILDFMIRSLGENVQKCKRNNKISFKNRLVKYPFENDLKSLPLEDCFACLKEFVYNPYQEIFPDPKNMSEWMLRTFGKGICERYLFPYNEKVWNIPVDQLSMAWADRIPNPPADDIIKSAIGFETEGYIHQLYYHYPKKGGYQAISETWAAGCKIKYGYKVSSIELLEDGKFLVSNGKESHVYAKLISTMPVHHLLQCLKIPMTKQVQEAVSGLIVNPMYIVSFGIRGIDTNQFTAIYFPEAEFLVNRISYPSTFSADNSPSGHYSIQAEITCTSESATWRMTDQEILEHVRTGLHQRGIIPDLSKIVLEDVQRKDLSYVVYDIHYEQNVKIVRSWFEQLGIHLVGRFSFFEYVNVDMAVERALKVASVLNGLTQEDSIKTHADLMERALTRISQAAQLNKTVHPMRHLSQNV